MKPSLVIVAVVVSAVAMVSAGVVVVSEVAMVSATVVVGVGFGLRM